MNTISTLNHQIATALKQLRASKGWSLDITAKETTVSKAMLGQIERQESSPTIATLMKIATGFNVSVSFFLEPQPDSDDTLFFLSSEDNTYQTQKDKLSITTIFPYNQSTQTEVLLISMAPNTEHHSPAHTPGLTEQLIVNTGKLDVMINNDWHCLKTGDGIRFEANQLHSYRNSSLKPISFYAIMHYLDYPKL